MSFSYGITAERPRPRSASGEALLRLQAFLAGDNPVQAMSGMATMMMSRTKGKKYKKLRMSRVPTHLSGIYAAGEPLAIAQIN
jgi:hypothetical protein